MTVLLAFVVLIGFLAWTTLLRDMVTGGIGSEGAKRLPEPVMWGPRGAIPATPPQTWVLTQDYPNIALQGDIQGTTSFRVSVSSFGDVNACKITQPSGYEELDTRVCSAITTRAKFYPALDADDRPTEGVYSSSVRWVIEE
ncbi:TonB family protein [Parasphingorhabdus sp.]|uniref:TonB family protein n=1 Tax=Parasphingorhabdus sp. TaxID=2709688 RepID=UPI003A8F10E2